MPECPPRGSLFAELLDRTLSVHRHAGTERSLQLTPITFCKSLSEYILMTFTATSRPQCSALHTSAKPPLNNALPARSGEIGIFKDVGRRAWRPHVLYNDFRQFSRAPDEISGLSSTCSIKRVVASFNWRGFAMMSGCRACLVYHIDKRLCAIPKEAADRVALILTREDHFD